MKYPEDYINQIINGDCLKVMKDIPDNSIDTCITDPPYGLESIKKRFGNKNSASAKEGEDGSFKRLSKGFMGQEWDVLPGVEIFEELYRILKPGAYLLCFGGTRTWHRLAVAIEDAGFEIRDSIAWLYGEGFPKALDISKGIDKYYGVERDVMGKQELKGSAKTLKGKANRENWYDQGEGGTFTPEINITIPKTEEAKLWDGWKTGLKPAFEPIIVAMKSVDKNYVNNALEHGIAGFNIDKCRIEVNGSDKNIRKNADSHNRKEECDCIAYSLSNKNKTQDNGYHNTKGRYPSNVILDEYAGNQIDKQSGYSNKTIRKTPKTKKGSKFIFNTGSSNCDYYGGFSDTGGASRFFYVAKASKRERNAGLENLESKTSHIVHGTIGRECSREKRIKETGQNSANIKNFHPTVKPIKLMEYLVRLTSTPTGGIIIDPFAGSGTTLVACQILGRPYIGIELNKEYCDIARARVKNVQPYLF